MLRDIRCGFFALIAAVGLLVGLVLPVQAQPAGDDVPTYTEGLVGEVRRLNPLFGPLNPVDADISSLIFEGLTTINSYGEVIPRLAEEWVVSFDGLE
ncbi:MAG: hypothetical protein ACOCYT_04640, partial [Chloroflexota bacterium]